MKNNTNQLVANYLKTLDTRKILKFVRFDLYIPDNLEENEYISIVSFIVHEKTVYVKYRFYEQTDDESETDVNDLTQLSDLDFYESEIKFEDIVNNTDIVFHMRKRKLKDLNK
jgi:hypothetical protein